MEVIDGETLSLMEKVDEDDELALYHWKEGAPDDMKHWRGVIIDKNTGKIAARCLPNHYDVVAGNSDDDIDLEGYDGFTAIEGALLRIFCHEDKWHISTNRRLDAFNSRWSSKHSFGDMFVYTLRQLLGRREDDILEFFYNSLDKDLTYIFMIRFNNDNRIVCSVHDVPVSERIVLIGVMRQDGWAIELVHNSLQDHSVLNRLGRQTPHPPMTFEEAKAKVLDSIDPMTSPGLFFFHRTENKQIKLVHPRYNELAQIRGNQPNLLLRYMELRRGDPQVFETFKQLYPRSAQVFDQMEATLEGVSRKINFWYNERYIHSRYVSVPYPEFVIMKKCHQWYLEDPVNRRVFIRVVTDFLNREEPLFLFRIINRYRKEMNRARPPIHA